MKSYDTDTIAAVSTGLGSAGIGIVRISGPQAVAIGEKLFRSVSGKALSTLAPQRLSYGHIVDPKTGHTVDEVMTVRMQGPHSYTAEDVVEINCHGGIVPTRKILGLVLESGARHAQAGEFTKRAFLNGRIDLTQAESVMDVIGAKSERALEISVSQLGGALKKKIKAVDADLIDLMVLIESNLDYPEYDIEAITEEKVLALIASAQGKISELFEQAKNSAVLRNGVQTAIVGEPNVGKSSLLNELLGDERAIVTDIAGTTRDSIQETILIDAVPFVLTDTAGIRETENAVEKIGVQKSLECAERADLVLFVRDASKALSADEEKLLAGLDPERTILIANKSDLQPPDAPDWIALSVKRGDGIEILKREMCARVLSGDVEGQESSVLLNARQEGLLRQARTHLEDARAGVESGLPEEIYAIDITDALEAIRAVTGEALGSDVIDTIFERFCIGK